MLVLDSGALGWIWQSSGTIHHSIPLMVGLHLKFCMALLLSSLVSMHLMILPFLTWRIGSMSENL